MNYQTVTNSLLVMGIFLLNTLVPAFASPVVSSVGPTPVYGAVEPVPLVLEGRGFSFGDDLVLRNKTLSKEYHNRPAISREAGRVVMMPTFGNRDADWSIEIIDKQGMSSGEYPFHVYASTEEQRKAAVVKAALPLVPPSSSSLPVQNSEASTPSSATQQGADHPPAFPSPTLTATAESLPPSPSRSESRLAGPPPASASLGGVEPPSTSTAGRFVRPSEVARGSSPVVGVTSAQSASVESYTPSVDATISTYSAASRDPSAEPERTTPVQISNRDINRIVCPGDIADAHWSEERPVKVTRSGSNLFVKVQIERQGDQVQSSTQPIDLHVVCDQAVYTLILNPSAVNAVTIRLLPSVSKSMKKIVHEWSALPVEQRVTKLTLMLIKGDYPDGFKRRAIPATDLRRHIILRTTLPDGTQQTVPGIRVTARYDLLATGTGLRGTEYELVSEQAREYRETDFLTPEFGDEAGITIEPLRARAGEPVRLIVVTRSVSDVD